MQFQKDVTEEVNTLTLSKLPLWFGGLLLLLTLPLMAGGLYLAWLGGSLFYLFTAVVLAASSYGFFKRQKLGVVAYLLLVGTTSLWAVYEVGFQFWPLVPRLAGILLLLIPVCLLATKVGFANRKAWVGASGITAALLIVGFVAMFFPHGVIKGVARPAVAGGAPDKAVNGNWQHYGRTPTGTRFAPLEQITPGNVTDLEVAWTFRTGEIADVGSENQNTPVQVGDTLFICTPLNKVFAIDANTGKEIWRFDAKVQNNKVWNRCRGVSFYDSTEVSDNVRNASAVVQDCPQRVILSTLDSRLIALDAKTGKQCQSFGNNGQVNLQEGMGEIKPTYYMGTSPVTVAGNLLIVGGWVYDNLEVNEPSGVIRAFNAATGELEWAWDLGSPAITKYPPEGQTYTRGTPNMWSTAAYDANRGLIFIPLGNSTPDFWGGHRSAAANHYASSVVALDYKTGRERWAYQTVHHDIWDYDIPAQPALYDVPDGNGGTIPALIQTTKTGNIFMLNRETGKPIADVVERGVPQQELAGDKTAPTQPFSVGMPYIGQEALKESDMWGATIYDQLLCRIQFKSLRYDGAFTPPGTTASLQHPGNFGGMNWGSVSINEDTGTMVVNDIRIPLRVQLIPSEHHETSGNGKPHSEFAPMRGTPFVVTNSSFVSPMDVPCQAPPYGTVTGIDLKTRQIIWQRPAGTVQDTAIAGVKVRAPFPIGMPTIGGTVSTRSGLVFFAGTQDYFLRAYDQSTGDELWKARMPVGSQATPMTFVSPSSNRQFVVVSAGGARSSMDRSDLLIAYALPKKQ
ncbi:quinate dehydrogenase [Pseudomonas putida]|uniref:Quinate dehydrogenase n=1 Tax=Pseudomonas putida TaxID=303 RepID=A0AA37VMV7_PSEPU|nr:membrane-bound PQQ-dependent dehydrogenase, glucose/quinate/shikimate family [Pseudomonas putida]GLO12081.1 quinate dehydrogenase [Pseudomonas putida]GLO35536.1 quinate dehydrogenase [Pseudomonas putida]HDS0962791.1 membrane-bound PQQ-dependent dehydrogenase, glucose/quinate/shikimate family [Pseudomonas putida]HDS0990025.1 membrane-bound PQQ-dependent dehydrogenase, glucose/quinate/shikimate family [Pseudomonas putida]